ncbi:MAG: dihydroorotate dehydrogenase electron transfer subunit [Anaerosomatales bacterium]|uniref:dihydroorotate dehydrogenase electron transfer subunit n=1 Tax=Parvivirga hydrogeniphila TaxID=2939460 RepID=UPI002260C3E2|nr:dihydroorotate dehydrogenase electron transfer subunit [Parvivirga hydrogeniphila]MCL4079689.1 dihydroorotate dehydrogenase electron transfer subunit [Parvivirga hydrogeniphila]MDI6693131.1 dihydroorotate dehydrogenase electron transfer subunit [Anaerosomatales bacterium]
MSADRRVVEEVVVEANERVATGVGLVALRAPRIAQSVLPGQFVHLRIAEGTAFILRRPFSVHRAHGETIEVLYQVVGTGTRWLSSREPGDAMDAIGPLGTGWSVPDGAAHALLVAGGLGAAPLGMLAEDLAARGVAVTVAQGAPTAERLVARDLFERVARTVATATDDGSAGVRGFVTALVPGLIEEIRPDVVYACGPEPMMCAVAAAARDAGVACQVSLERLMACGVGACLSCTVTTRSGLKRACADGPVFDAADVVWAQDEVEGLKR